MSVEILAQEMEVFTGVPKYCDFIENGYNDLD
jgi:hypothetical protein